MDKVNFLEIEYMKLKAYNKMEMIGLGIILLATTFQLTLLSIVTDISENGQFYVIEEKLNLIWYEIRDSSLGDPLPDTRAQSFNSLTGGEGRVYDQKESFGKGYAISMIFGSILLLLGRYMELKNRAKKESPL